MGENGWGALEIIVVLVLVIAILGRFFGPGAGKPVPDVATYKGKEQPTVPSFNDCGKLLVTAPTSLQKIPTTVMGVVVQGSFDNCNTISVEPENFSITVVDAYATTIVPPVYVPISQNSKGVQSFSQYVSFVAPPRAGTGYVIVTRISNVGTQVQGGGARIPVRFVN